MSGTLTKFMGKFSEDGKIKDILEQAPNHTPVGWKNSPQFAKEFKEQMTGCSSQGDFKNAEIFKEKKNFWQECAEMGETLMKKCIWAVNFAPSKIEYHKKREEFLKCEYYNNLWDIAQIYPNNVPSEDM
jgi:hypothetical protein